LNISGTEKRLQVLYVRYNLVSLIKFTEFFAIKHEYVLKIALLRPVQNVSAEKYTVRNASEILLSSFLG